MPDALKPHERAAMEAKGLKPIPFPDCTGHIQHRLGRPDHTHGECFRCIRWSSGKGGHDHSRIVTAEDGAPHCADLRTVLTGDQIAAMDETMSQAPDCAPASQASPVFGLGVGIPSSEHSGEVSQ